MGAHRTATPSRLAVVGARALTAATALTLLGGGAGVALAGQDHDGDRHHGHHYDDYINDSPRSESSSDAEAVNTPATDLSQDQFNEQDADQDNEQFVEQEQDQDQEQEQEEEQGQDQDQEEEQDQDQEQDVVVPFLD